MPSFRIELPVPPSLNNIYVTNRRTGGRLMSARAKEWKEAAAWLIALAKPPRFDGGYKLTVLLPMGLRGDVDNRCKLPSDALTEAGVIKDDSLAIETTCRRDGSVADGQCVLVVESAA